LQTSGKSRLVQRDIFYPAQYGSPSLPAAPAPTTRCGGIRSGRKSTKVNFVAAAQGAGSAGGPAWHHSLPRSLPVSLWMK
jgi:hypothetical protein